MNRNVKPHFERVSDTAEKPAIVNDRGSQFKVSGDLDAIYAISKVGQGPFVGIPSENLLDAPKSHSYQVIKNYAFPTLIDNFYGPFYAPRDAKGVIISFNVNALALANTLSLISWPLNTGGGAGDAYFDLYYQELIDLGTVSSTVKTYEIRPGIETAPGPVGDEHFNHALPFIFGLKLNIPVPGFVADAFTYLFMTFTG